MSITLRPLPRRRDVNIPTLRIGLDIGLIDLSRVVRAILKQLALSLGRISFGIGIGDHAAVLLPLTIRKVYSLKMICKGISQNL